MPGLGDDRSHDQNVGSGLAGKFVSHFRVLAILGAGGMGTVYEAEDTKLGRRVALKVLPEEMADDPAALKRFEREARTTSSLNHHNICTIFAVEEFERQPVIVMELLEGETLRDRLARVTKEPVSLVELLDIALQTCDGLAAAHSRGIIHRDIKPANLFLITSDQSAKRWVKILDFGLAKLMLAEPSNDVWGLNATASGVKLNEPPLAESDISTFRAGGAAGTASYMSPEQIRREVLDARTDLFSFGLVLYEMATGQRAFPGDDPAKVREALLHEEPVPVRQLNPSIPAALETVIGTALEKDRGQRHQSATALKNDLERIVRDANPVRKRVRRAIAAEAFGIPSKATDIYWPVTRSALENAEAGRDVQARRYESKADRSKLDPDDKLVLSLAPSRSGQIEEAGKLADQISAERPEDTLVQHYLTPTIRAAIKLQQHDPAAAIDLLRGTARYDLAYTDSFDYVYPAYIRGLAYLELGDGRSAAAQFQKLIDNPGLTVRHVTGPLAWLQLGRAQKMMGDEATARKSYETFLDLWKNADPDVPIYRQAKAEFAKLPSSEN